MTHPLETGIQNGPRAIAIILLTFSSNLDIALILSVPALYSLFIVLLATVVTVVFRGETTAAGQKIPSLLKDRGGALRTENDTSHVLFRTRRRCQ